MEAVAITGTIGAGKTSVAEALSEDLHGRGIRHGLIDLDWLGGLYPPLDPDDPYSLELSYRNLRLILPGFVEAGADRFVISATLTSIQEGEGLRGILGDVNLTICRLTASPAVIAERIRRREHGRLLEDFLARTDAVAEQIAAAGFDGLVVRNEGSPSDAAAEIVGALGW